MKKPEAKKDLRKAIAGYLKGHDKEIRKAIMEEVSLKDFFGWQAKLYDDDHVLISDYYEDLQDYEDDAREVYDKVAKAKKVYLLFDNRALIGVYLDKETFDRDAKWAAQECKMESQIDGFTHKAEMVESTLWECNPQFNFAALFERIEEWTNKYQANHVKELFQKSLEDGKLRSYVILNFKASKLDKPVMSWSNIEWKKEMAKFVFFANTLANAAGHKGIYKEQSVNDFLRASDMWGKLEDDLAKRILDDYRRS